jgi:hypothetical protein
MRGLQILVIAGALTAAAIAPASADFIYSNLGTSPNVYNQFTGATISGADSLVGLDLSHSESFAVSGSYQLSQIDLGLGFVSGTNSAVVSLWEGATELGSWNVSDLPGFGSTSSILTTIDVSGITLGTGAYTILVSAGASDTWDAWNWTPDGTDSAYDVIGTPIAVPEPGTLALLGVGLAAFAGFRRRKASQRQNTQGSLQM